ncbi:MAG: hypothetical protein H6672_20015 [Anaerolineaceae bacterium]|nr:hypothetical protein [Anaerolineaceae bacterium]
MKRLLLVFGLLLLTIGVVVVPVAAQDGPSGTWLGTWPYTAPGTHDLSNWSANGLEANLGSPVYRPLVLLQPAFYMWSTGEYVGILAESFGFTDDFSAYEYTIKEGALWSNGDPITSEDVVDTFAIGRIMGWSDFTYIDTVTAVDERTVRFDFLEGKASKVAERLILKDYIVPRATYGDLAAQALQLVADGKTADDQEWKDLATAISEFHPDTLIVSGPYTYSLDDVGEAFMTLHWQPNSLYSDSVQFGEIKLWAGETEVSTPLVLSGELAFSTNVFPPATIQSFADAGLRLVTVPLGYGPALLFNFDVDAFQNKLVRQAMAYAINREQSALLTNGLGASATRYMSGILDALTPVLLSADGVAALNPYEYNLDTAASLMEQAGYTRNADGKWVDANGATLSFEYTFPADFADFSAAARDAVSQLNDFGFDITERALPWQQAAQANREGDFQLSVWSWGSGSPFAYNNLNNPTRRWTRPVLAEDQPGTGLGLQMQYNGQDIDLNDLILNVSAGLDNAQLQAQADYVSSIINDEMFFIPLNEELSVEPVNENLIGGVPAAGDPIFDNPANETWVTYLLLTGVLHPAN